MCLKLGLGFLCVQLGMALAATDSPLYHTTRNGIIAAKALLSQMTMQNEKYPDFLWSPSRHKQQGLVKSDPARADEGYTLYSSGHEAAVVAVDMDGQEVHRWSAPFSSVWPSPSHLPQFVVDNTVFIRRFHLYENGDILALYESTAATPNGCGLARLDRTGKPVWTYDACTHHDVHVAADGRIYVLTQSMRTAAHPNFEFLPAPQVEEFVAILSPEGKERQKFSLFDVVGSSRCLRQVITRGDEAGDVLHSNTVYVVGDKFASHYSGMSPDDVMVCLRNLNLVVVISPKQEKVVWATYGPWHYPHDSTPMDDGSILIFNNSYTLGEDVHSRVLQYDPLTDQIDWSFSKAEGTRPLISYIRAGQQRLANGNTLITESDHGRLLEVAPDGSVVWEFVNPVRGSEDSVSLTPVISSGLRYPRSRLGHPNTRTATAETSAAATPTN